MMRVIMIRGSADVRLSDIQSQANIAMVYDKMNSMHTEQTLVKID